MTPSAPEATGDDQSPVYEVSPECIVEDLEVGARYLATVDGVVDYGIFVELAPDLSGLVHDSLLDASYAVGDDIVVELQEVRENGDLSFRPAEGAAEDEETVRLEPEYDVTPVEDLADVVGERVHLHGEVAQIKQTGGPTIFHVRDETGVVPCAAFEEAGVRAYPALGVHDLVHVVGRIERREESIQVEAERIESLGDTHVPEAHERIREQLSSYAAPPDIEPLVDWDALDAHWEDIESVATLLRQAAIEHRPVYLRYHADTDGMCAALPLAEALERFIRKSTHLDPEAPQHLIRRLPSKAPYYELEDVTRDLNSALDGRERHGQKLPLILMIDNGSTEEDIPAYEMLERYDVPVVVIDHHHPDADAVSPYLDEHINPYLEGDDYRVTTGMLCAELARMIDPTITDELIHAPAVAGLADRSSADAMDDYLALAEDAGADETFCRAIGEALDYAAYWLRYSPGERYLEDVLGIGDDDAHHRDLVDFLADRAARDVDRQLAAVRPHVDHERLANGAHLYRADLEEFAHRFTYPPPGRTTGAVHDRMVDETGEPVITVGFGPDFAVLRSDGVKLDIPQMVEALKADVPGSGVSGGGHLVVGSIRFVPGMREAVVDALVEMMADAEIDTSLQATARRTGIHSRDR